MGVDDFPDDNSTSGHRPVSLRMSEIWTPEPGDLDWDRQVTVADLDLLTEKLLADTEDFAFDVNGDRSIDRRDRDVWIRDVRQLYVGNANLDGGFDGRDIFQVFVSGEYRDGLAQNSTWVTGTVTGSSANETRGCLHRRRLQQRPSGRHACAECVLARLERCLHKVSCLVCIADLKNQIWHPPPRGRHR